MYNKARAHDVGISHRGGSRIFGLGFKLAEGGSICAVCPFFPEIPHENEII